MPLASLPRPVPAPRLLAPGPLRRAVRTLAAALARGEARAHGVEPNPGR